MEPAAWELDSRGFFEALSRPGKADRISSGFLGLSSGIGDSFPVNSTTSRNSPTSEHSPSEGLFSTVLQRLSEGSKEYFGAASIEIEAVRFEERIYSFILEIRVNGNNERSTAFVKRYKVPEGVSPVSIREQVIAEFNVLQDKCKAMAGYPGFRVVRPIAYWSDELTIVTERAQGKTLPEILNARVSWRWSAKQQHLIDLFERVGAWPRVFQSTDSSSAMLSTAEMREYVDVRLKQLAQAGAVSPGFCSALLSQFDATARDVNMCELAEVPTHVDFSPHNVLASEEAITLLDISARSSGSRYYDLAHMFVHLENLKIRPWMGVRLVEQMQAAMLRGYDPGLTPDRPLFRMELMRNVVSHLVHQREHSGTMLQRLYALLAWRNTRWHTGVWC